jgi:hypothetical protein
MRKCVNLLRSGALNRGVDDFYTVKLRKSAFRKVRDGLGWYPYNPALVGMIGDAAERAADPLGMAHRQEVRFERGLALQWNSGECSTRRPKRLRDPRRGLCPPPAGDRWPLCLHPGACGPWLT